MAANFINDTDVLRLATKVNALRGAGMVPSGGLLFNKGNFFQLMVTGTSSVTYTIIAEPSDSAFQLKANIVSGLGAFALGAALYMNGYFIQAFGDMAGSGGGGGSLPDGDTVDQTIQWDGTAWQPGVIPADGLIFTMDDTIGAPLPTIKQDPASALPVAYVVLDLSVGDGNGGLYGMLDDTGAAAFQLITSGFPATPGLTLIGPGGAGSVVLDTGNSTLRSPGGINQFACSTTATSIVHNSTSTWATAGSSAANGSIIITRPFGATYGLAMTQNTTTLQSVTNAGYISLSNVGNSDYFNTLQHRFNAQIVPTTDNTLNLGGASTRWATVFAGTGTINTSDADSKTAPQAIPDAVLDAWAKVNYVQFKFLDAVEAKGDGARLHTGVIAQQVAQVFDDAGLDAHAYGLLCYDEWDARPEELDEDGVVRVPAMAAGSRYGVRYEEALVMECALMRRELAKLVK